VTIKEIAERLEKAFPNWKIGTIGHVIVGDANNPIMNKVAWRIIMTDPEEEEK